MHCFPSNTKDSCPALVSVPLFYKREALRCLTSIFLSSVSFLFLQPNSHTVFHHYVSDKKDETIRHGSSSLPLPVTDSRGDDIALRMSEVSLQTESGFTPSLPVFKYDLGAKLSSLITSHLFLSYFSKTVSKNFFKTT